MPPLVYGVLPGKKKKGRGVAQSIPQKPEVWCMAEEQDREGMRGAPVGPCSKKMYTAAVTSFVLQHPLWTLLGAREGPNPLKPWRDPTP